jgi:hypothetical protein
MAFSTADEVPMGGLALDHEWVDNHPAVVDGHQTHVHLPRAGVDLDPAPKQPDVTSRRPVA